MSIGGCAGRLMPIETPRDKLRAVSTALLILCKGNFSDEQIKVIWEQEFPGQAVYPFLSSKKGKELAEILKQWEDESSSRGLSVKLNLKKVSESEENETKKKDGIEINFRKRF